MVLSNLPEVSSPFPWHEREWTQLNAQLAEGRLPHALLLVGRQHIGKSQLALALSRLLLCAQAKDLLNCGQCHACELSAQGNHGDFRWVEPIEKSTVIKIEQIREVVRFTNTTAGFGSRKVVVLSPADRMNVNSFNALLKSLEEPSRGTYLILVCNQLQSIPATIRSRCHLLHLAAPDTQACLKWMDKLTGNPVESQSLVSIADGLPLLALQFYRRGGSEEHVAKRLGLASLAAGRGSVPELALLWQNEDIGAVLKDLAVDLQLRIGSLSLDQLRTKPAKAVFALLDEVNQLQQAARAGANPNKQLLLLGVLSKYRRELGTAPLGDNILKQMGDVGV